MKKRCFAMFLMFVLTIVTASGQEAWHKKFVKQDMLYMKGDYKLARELNHNLTIKIKTSVGPQNAYMALAQFKDAKYHAGAGYINAYKRSVSRGFSIARGATGRNNPEFATIALEGVEILVKYGDYAQAEGLLNEINGIFEEYNNKDIDLESQKKYLLAQVYAAQGHYQKSLDMLIQLRDYMADLTLKNNVKDRFARPDRNKKRNLTAFEIKQNKRSYAAYLSLAGKLYGKIHQQEKADSAFNVAKMWIINNLSEKDYSMFKYRFGQLEMAKVSDSTDVHVSKLEKLIKQAEGSINKNQELVLDMKYTLLKWYQKSNELTKYNTLKTHLANINEKYYDEKNINTVKLKLIVLREKSDTLTDIDRIQAAKDLLKQSIALPDVHKLRIEILKYLHEKSQAAGLQTESEEYLRKIEQVKKALYGEGSPIVSS